MTNGPRPPEGADILLRKHERECLFPYDDKTGLPLKPGQPLQGKLSIGVGRNLTTKGITTTESSILLANDIHETWDDLLTALPWVEAIGRVRQLVVTDMAFNLGVEGFLAFKQTIAHLKAKAYDNASVAMLQSLWAEQVGGRSLRLAEMMRTGTLPSDVKGL